MSKEMWCAAHERAIEEAMEADPDLEWSAAYSSDAVAARAQEIYEGRVGDMIDAARDRMKYADVK